MGINRIIGNWNFGSKIRMGYDGLYLYVGCAEV